MGAITLVDTPTEIEGSFSNLKNLSQAEVLHRLALDANNLASQGLIQQAPATGSFSISDFLVPGLQTKTWEDWQVADELNPFATTADAQTYSTNLIPMPFQFGLDGVMMGDVTWDAATAAVAGLPSDMAYDEFVFDLSPSHFSTPATINVADLIVGPDSTASSTVVSPRDLQMPLSHDAYEDLALADFYGFTEQDDTCIFDSDSGSDLSDIDSLSDDDDDDDDENDDDDDKTDEVAMNSAKNNDLVHVSESVIELEDATSTLALSAANVTEFASQQIRVAKEDPNKRRMEEALVARINNDLGPEHMSGLFQILRGGDAEDDDEDEELEVDLSRLDETTLVQLYQYVETCCMQTLGSILAAEKEEQERQKREAAAAAAALAAAKKAQEEQEALEYARALEMRSTPELSPSHSSSSSSPSVSPSPPHHQSSYSATECGSSNNKKRSATNSTSCTYKYERNDVEKQAEALWMNTQHKSKRKRMTNNSPVCMGGGGTGKGQRIKKSMMMDQEEQQLQLQQQQQQQDEESDEIGEDDEIDIVGF